MLKILLFHLAFLFGNYHSTEPVAKLFSNSTVNCTYKECPVGASNTDVAAEPSPFTVLLSM